MDKVIHKVREWVESQNKKVIIGISGHGAAGKTTFTKKLMKAFSEEVTYLNTDPYIISSRIRNHAPIDYEYRGEKHHYKMTACHPSAHFTEALERDIRMIKEGLNFFTMEMPYRRSEYISAGRQINLIEGMTVAFTDPALYDLLIYFYTDGDNEFKRRTERDVSERGASIEFLKASHAERRIQYELFMHDYSLNFDLIVRTTDKDYTVEKMEFPLNAQPF